MRQINLLFSLYSLTALIVIIERLSFTTDILLQPYDFIRLHELIQTNVLLLATVIISFLVFKQLTNNFQELKGRHELVLALLFVSGVYLYGAREGWHEVASFTLNQYCNPNLVEGSLCGGLFINDYYTGNIIFFVGGVLMNYSLLALSAKIKFQRFDNKNFGILIANSIVYGFTWFAYAAFDKVLVGFFFAVLLMIISYWYCYKAGFKFREYPYITYSFFAYTLATLGTFLVRFIRF